MTPNIPDIRLRLLAIERGEVGIAPPTDEELAEALLARIGTKKAAILTATEQVSKKSKGTPKGTPKGTAIDL